MTEAQVVLITGGNTGLGLETVRALYQSAQAYHIMLGSRARADAEAAIVDLRAGSPHSASTLAALELDVTSDASIAAAAAQLADTHGRLDVLVNNAGVNLDREIQAGRLSLREAWLRAWDVNVVGAHALTTAVMPWLLRGGGGRGEGSTSPSPPRVLFITSGTSALADSERMDAQYATINAAPPAGWPKEPTLNPTEAYRSTKAGLNMLMRQWHRILLNDGVKVFAVSPGFLATGLAGIGQETLTKIGALDPSVGGKFVRDVIQGKRDGDEGKAINTGGIQPW